MSSSLQENRNEQHTAHRSVCPICQGSGIARLEAFGHTIFECASCVHRFALPPSRLDEHVSSIYSDDYFFGGGPGYQGYVSDEAILVARAVQYTDLLSQYCEPGKILDVGAAIGFTMKAFAARGWKTTGLEPNLGMTIGAADHLGLDIHNGTLETWQTDKQFDVVTMLQVIAHFHTLQQAMERAAEVTRPRGFWLVETWNYQSLTARILGRHWHEYSPPSVLHWFSLKSITRLGKQHGFEVIAKGRPKKTISGSHAKSLLRYRLQTLPGGRILSPLTHVVPDRINIPYPAEDLFWVLLQKM